MGFRLSNFTNSCTAAYPTVSPNPSFCNPYRSGGYCFHILGSQSVYGSSWTVRNNEQKLQRFDEGKKIMLVYGLQPRKTCLDMFDDVYCHWYFPRCDATTSYLRPQPVCRESCELLMKTCDKELEMAIRFNEQQAAGGYPYYWEIMNCTEMRPSDGGQAPECYFQQKINSKWIKSILFTKIIDCD